MEFMKTCKEQVGEKYLQDSALFTPWYLTFRCLTIREKTLQKNNNRLAVVRCATQQRILIKPNTSVSIHGYLNQETEYHPTCAIMESTPKSVIPDDLDIAPTVINYNFKQTGIVKVNVSNITTRTVSIPPNAILCELQPVVVENKEAVPTLEKIDNLTEQVKIENSDLSDSQLNTAKDLINEFEDIFSKGDTDIGHYKGVEHQINLKDETPFQQRYRRIPPAMIDEVRSHLEQLLAAGIIRK